MRRRRIAAFAVSVAMAFAAVGCALPTNTDDLASAYDPDEWSDPPSGQAVVPLAASGDAPASGTWGWTPAQRASGPLPSDFADRITAAQEAATARGADITVSVLDRTTGDRFGVDTDTEIETASVAKLFIADEVLHRNASPSDDDLDLIARMLESSDDSAADILWWEYGDSDIVESVATRYGLTHTSAPWDDNWWNTVTTTDDLVDYYAGLLDGSGGLDMAGTARIVTDLRASSATAADGYDQTFGIPGALTGYASDEVAVKQGWMCCLAGRWVHLSTAVIGPDSRYIVVVSSHEDVDYGDQENADNGSDDPDSWAWATEWGYASLPDTSIDPQVDDPSGAHARQTLTDVVRILFPDGDIR